MQFAIIRPRNIPDGSLEFIYFSGIAIVTRRNISFDLKLGLSSVPGSVPADPKCLEIRIQH